MCSLRVSNFQLHYIPFTAHKFRFLVEFSHFLNFFEFVLRITPFPIVLGRWNLVCKFIKGSRYAFWEVSNSQPRCTLPVHPQSRKSCFFFVNSSSFFAFLSPFAALPKHVQEVEICYVDLVHVNFIVFSYRIQWYVENFFL